MLMPFASIGPASLLDSAPAGRIRENSTCPSHFRGQPTAQETDGQNAVEHHEEPAPSWARHPRRTRLEATESAFPRRPRSPTHRQRRLPLLTRHADHRWTVHSPNSNAEPPSMVNCTFATFDAVGT